jgi:uncharacterized membrane protein
LPGQREWDGENVTDRMNRVVFLDIARGLAVLFMFTQHCMILFEVDKGEGDDILANVFTLLGTAPAAPVFMLVMGVFLAKSQAPLLKSIRRGVILLLLGYLLNFCRFFVPIVAGITGFEALPEGESALHLILAVDILQLAGLAFMIGALLKEYDRYKFAIPPIVVGVLLISPSLWGLFEDAIVPWVLWGAGKTVYFPLFPWIIYPLLGMYLSDLLTDSQSLKKHMARFLGIGFGLVVTGAVSMWLFPVGDYYRSGFPVHLLMTGFVLLWLSMLRRITSGIDRQIPVIRLLLFWSKNVTAMYFVQWLLFGWGTLLFGVNKQNAITAATIGMAVLLATHLVVRTARVRKLFSHV